MASISINEEVTQHVIFPTVAENTGLPKVVKQAIRFLDKQPGWTSVHWGQDINNLYGNNTHAYITWADIQYAQSFATCPFLVNTSSSTDRPTVSETLLNLKGSVSHQHPTEAVTFYFSSATLTDENKQLFETQVQQAILQLQQQNGQEIHILSTAKGWGVGTVIRGGEDACVFVILVAWSSLHSLHDVKKDAESLFNNTFAPLKELAPLGVDTSLYTSLKVKQNRQGGCVIS